jgi:Baseplate J-like protein
MPTNVPTPTFTSTGFVTPAAADIITGVQEDMNTAFGGNLNFGTTAGSITNPTPQGQLASSFAAIIQNTYETFQYYTTQTDPSYAEGRMQDAIGRIYFLERNQAVPTSLVVQCIGLAFTVIPAGSLIVDPNNVLYFCSGTITIPSAGTVNATFTQQVTGTATILVPSSVPTEVSIYSGFVGWDAANLISGIQGTPVESQTAFEQRRSLATAQNSIGSLPSILGAVLAVPGVFSAFVTENATASPLLAGGTTLVANSVYVAVVGGSTTSIAQAIWTRKPPGCNMNGNTTVVVEDTSPSYIPPFPSYNITFEIPTFLPMLFSVDMVDSNFIPGNATTLIQSAIVSQGAALTVGAQGLGGIGSNIQSATYIPAISSLGSWALGQVISVQIGSMNDPDACLCFGSCSGTQLTITSISSGTVTAGQTVTDGSGAFLPGTTIVSQLSGTVGSTGVYVVSQPNTVASTTFIGLATPDQDSVQVNINQYPTFSAANIVVNYLT